MSCGRPKNLAPDDTLAPAVAQRARGVGIAPRERTMPLLRTALRLPRRTTLLIPHGGVRSCVEWWFTRSPKTPSIARPASCSRALSLAVARCAQFCAQTRTAPVAAGRPSRASPVRYSSHHQPHRRPLALACSLVVQPNPGDARRPLCRLARCCSLGARIPVMAVSEVALASNMWPSPARVARPAFVKSAVLSGGGELSADGGGGFLNDGAPKTEEAYCSAFVVAAALGASRVARRRRPRAAWERSQVVHFDVGAPLNCLAKPGPYRPSRLAANAFAFSAREAAPAKASSAGRKSRVHPSRALGSRCRGPPKTLLAFWAIDDGRLGALPRHNLGVGGGVRRTSQSPGCSTNSAPPYCLPAPS